MTTTPNFSHALFTTPFDHTTDFTELADNCARFVDVLVECDDPTQKLALCGRLSASDERVAGDLLQDLTGFYGDPLKAPRWLRTTEGVVQL